MVNHILESAPPHGSGKSTLVKRSFENGAGENGKLRFEDRCQKIACARNLPDSSNAHIRSISIGSGSFENTKPTLATLPQVSRGVRLVDRRDVRTRNSRLGLREVGGVAERREGFERRRCLTFLVDDLRRLAMRSPLVCKCRSSPNCSSCVPNSACCSRT